MGRKFFLVVCMMVSICNLTVSGQNIEDRLERIEGVEEYNFDVDDITHVLIINAYHQGFEWTDNQIQGIIDVIEDYDENILISVEYLDWKNYPTQQNLDFHYDILKYKYQYANIDVIIGTDDYGMQFAIDHRQEIFDNAPIVFTAVFEDSANERMVGVDNITGVYESTDPEGTIQLMMDLQPEIENVYIIRDNSESALHLENNIRNSFDRIAPDIELTPLNDYSYVEIKHILENPIDNSAIFMGSYNSDSEGLQLPNETFCAEYDSVTDIPIYSVYEYLYGYGIVGGSLLSGYLQGEAGAKLAIQIIEGTPADDIEPMTTKTVYYGVDYEKLSEQGIAFKDVPDYVIDVIKRPVSLFQQYKAVIIITLSTMVAMFGFILVLMATIRHRKHVEDALRDSHEELKSSNDSLMKSEVKLKKQNDALHRQQERINFLAYNDYLTGLPNRLEIKRYSEKMMDVVDRDGEKLLVAFIDLDNFKYINTSYGHKAGDIILEQLSGRFNTLTSQRCQLGRIGGDEFVCLARIEEDSDCEDYIERITELFVQRFSILGQSLYLSASIGYALYPDDAVTYDDLLIRADMAMFKMKEMGKSQAGRFDIDMDYEMNRKINIINELHEAINLDEFHMVYQPQYNIRKDQIIGFEALIRWDNKKLGTVSPVEFIGIAESVGLIVPIGEWVIRESVYFMKVLSMSRKQKITMAINISVVQLLQKDFAKNVKDILTEIDVDPNMIEFEITESVFIESFDAVKEQLEAIRALGIQIALDDFGTGYSSLTYLKNLPLSTLKIDRDFINDIILEGDKHFLTESIINIGKNLGYKIIAEGVEEERQKVYLQKYNCDIMQGFLFSKPLSRHDALELFYEYNNEDTKKA